MNPREKADIVDRLRDPEFAGPMRHLQDWYEIDTIMANAATEITSLRAALTAAPASAAHSNKLRSSLENVAESLSSRPRELRGPFDSGATATEIASLRRELEAARERNLIANERADNAQADAEAPLLERALRIAHGAHDGQTDKTGAPYILHPLRVALMGECADDRVVGLLHDVVEDCEEWPLERLRAHFPPRILDAVDALTKRDGEDYVAFIDRVKLNAIAARVKMNDLADNIDPTRLNKLPADLGARLQRKYSAAIRNLAGEKADG